MKTVFRAAAILVLALAGCATGGSGPRNLDLLKAEIRDYVDAGTYEREMAAVATRAGAWLTECAAQRTAGEHLAVVFDLDETLLSNLPFILDDDFGGSDAAWNEWMGSGKDPAIAPVREVYRTARKLDIAVFFLTSRRENLRAATAANLRAIGCGDYAALVMMPESRKDTASKFKTAERKRLAAEGYVIVANIGDQESDLVGGYAERTFKLPDPFYFTP